MDDSLYDEFGNYIGPELSDDVVYQAKLLTSLLKITSLILIY